MKKKLYQMKIIFYSRMENHKIFEKIKIFYQTLFFSLFYSYYFGRCSSELAQLVPLAYSQRKSTRYSDRLYHFSVTIPRCYKDAYVTSFFARIVRLWNFLLIEYFSLI